MADIGSVPIRRRRPARYSNCIHAHQGCTFKVKFVNRIGGGFQMLCANQHNAVPHPFLEAFLGVRLKFEFPFYGHRLANLTIATGGFLYVGDQRAFSLSKCICGATATSLSSTNRVICSLEAEITAPRKKPGSGSISFSLDFLPMAHPSAVDASASSDSEVEQCLSMLESLYRDTYCIDFETLCIEIDKYVFDIRCTIKVLDYDGGLFDACTLAVSTALMGFKRNDVTYNAVTKKLKSHSAYDKALVPLTLYYKPATITFGFISGIDEPMVDPTLEESSLIEGSLTIGANHRDEICLMHQCGNLRINSARVQKCCELTLRYARELSKEINKACTKPTQRN
ncbi:hypothetical protein niasHT_030208 [Heterodera trifolii]|uniref:Ribosomal RNA-processing protein 43 n=1 Tax=Heterodera trifolii TaxID=157864 RepID=A0ABD2K320_9BILA